MKQIKNFIIVAASVMMLAGCGASFDVSSSDLQTYADNNSGTLTDVTESHSDEENVENVYLLEVENASVEMWVFDSSTSASSWFNDNTDELLSIATTKVGSTAGDSGDYKFTVGDDYYRVVYSGDKCIYAYGDSDTVDSVLSSMNIIK